MGLRKFLFPWYRWSDRWAWHVEPLPDGAGLNPIVFTCPHDARFDILSIMGMAEGHPLGSGFKVVITLRRGQHIYAVTNDNLGPTGSQMLLIAFQRSGLGATRPGAADRLGWYLPESFIMLPGDTMTIDAFGGGLTDHLHNWTFSAKRWED